MNNQHGLQNKDQERFRKKTKFTKSYKRQKKIMKSLDRPRTEGTRHVKEVYFKETDPYLLK